MNKQLDTFWEHSKVAKEIGLKPLYSKEEEKFERNIRTCMKKWFK